MGSKPIKFKKMLKKVDTFEKMTVKIVRIDNMPTKILFKKIGYEHIRFVKMSAKIVKI